MNTDEPFGYYVINLDSSKERWQHINEHISSYGIDITKVSAIYGADLTSQEIAKYYTPELNKKQFFMPLKAAEIGCFLSHLRALKIFVNNNKKMYAVILEDDVEFIGDMRRFRHQWLDAVQGQEPTMLKLFSRRKVYGPLVYSQHGLNTIRPRLIPLGTQCTVYNRPAAVQLLATYNQFGMPIDVAYQYWWEHGVRVLVSESNHVNEISAQLGGSNISDNYDFPLPFKIKRELKRSWYRFKLVLNSLYQYSKAY